MSVLNRITNITAFKEQNPWPEIDGTFELHVFFLPLNPSDKVLNVYKNITNKINEARKEEFGNSKIKACFLALDFKGKGFVNVMQSARYVVSHSMDQAINELHNEADCYTKFIEQAYQDGELDRDNLDEELYVVREKLETLASSNGVPVSNIDTIPYNKKYFEFHIRLSRKNDFDNSPVSDDELKELLTISYEFTELFNVPVPLSFNRTNEHQRFLNVRFRNMGSVTARAFVAEIVEAINNSKSFKWDKTIAEYVPFDSYTAMDKGWIDF